MSLGSINFLSEELELSCSEQENSKIFNKPSTYLIKNNSSFSENDTDIESDSLQNINLNDEDCDCNRIYSQSQQTSPVELRDVFSRSNFYDSQNHSSYRPMMGNFFPNISTQISMESNKFKFNDRKSKNMQNQSENNNRTLKSNYFCPILSPNSLAQLKIYKSNMIYNPIIDNIKIPIPKKSFPSSTLTTKARENSENQCKQFQNNLYEMPNQFYQKNIKSPKLNNEITSDNSESKKLELSEICPMQSYQKCLITENTELHKRLNDEHRRYLSKFSTEVETNNKHAVLIDSMQSQIITYRRKCKFLENEIQLLKTDRNNKLKYEESFIVEVKKLTEEIEYERARSTELIKANEKLENEINLLNTENKKSLTEFQKLNTEFINFKSLNEANQKNWDYKICKYQNKIAFLRNQFYNLLKKTTIIKDDMTKMKIEVKHNITETASHSTKAVENCFKIVRNYLIAINEKESKVKKEIADLKKHQRCINEDLKISDSIINTLENANVQKIENLRETYFEINSENASINRINNFLYCLTDLSYAISNTYNDSEIISIPENISNIGGLYAIYVALNGKSTKIKEFENKISSVFQNQDKLFAEKEEALINVTKQLKYVEILENEIESLKTANIHLTKETENSKALINDVKELKRRDIALNKQIISLTNSVYNLKQEINVIALERQNLSTRNIDLISTLNTKEEQDLIFQNQIWDLNRKLTNSEKNVEKLNETLTATEERYSQVFNDLAKKENDFLKFVRTTNQEAKQKTENEEILSVSLHNAKALNARSQVEIKNLKLRMKMIKQSEKQGMKKQNELHRQLQSVYTLLVESMQFSKIKPIVNTRTGSPIKDNFNRSRLVQEEMECKILRRCKSVTNNQPPKFNLRTCVSTLTYLLETSQQFKSTADLERNRCQVLRTRLKNYEIEKLASSQKIAVLQSSLAETKLSKHNLCEQLSKKVVKLAILEKGVLNKDMELQNLLNEINILEKHKQIAENEQKVLLETICKLHGNEDVLTEEYRRSNVNAKKIVADVLFIFKTVKQSELQLKSKIEELNRTVEKLELKCTESLSLHKLSESNYLHQTENNNNLTAQLEELIKEKDAYVNKCQSYKRLVIKLEHEKMCLHENFENSKMKYLSSIDMFEKEADDLRKQQIKAQILLSELQHRYEKKIIKLTDTHRYDDIKSQVSLLKMENAEIYQNFTLRELSYKKQIHNLKIKIQNFVEHKSEENNEWHRNSNLPIPRKREIY